MTYNEHDWEYKIGMVIWPILLGGLLIETLMAQKQGNIENIESVLFSVMALDKLPDERSCEHMLEKAHDNVTIVRAAIDHDKIQDELHKRNPKVFNGSFATQRKNQIAALPEHLREIVYNKIYAPQGIRRDEVFPLDGGERKEQ